MKQEIIYTKNGVTKTITLTKINIKNHFKQIFSKCYSKEGHSIYEIHKDIRNVRFANIDFSGKLTLFRCQGNQTHVVFENCLFNDNNQILKFGNGYAIVLYNCQFGNNLTLLADNPKLDLTVINQTEEDRINYQIFCKNIYLQSNKNKGTIKIRAKEITLVGVDNNNELSLVADNTQILYSSLITNKVKSNKIKLIDSQIISLNDENLKISTEELSGNNYTLLSMFDIQIGNDIYKKEQLPFLLLTDQDILLHNQNKVSGLKLVRQKMKSYKFNKRN